MRDFGPLLERLDRLKRLDSGNRVYGAWSHKYVLNPPAAERDVCQFEERNAIKLPDEYRDFLIHVGNGGAGPGCDGLWPLKIDNDYGGLLGRPFPFSELWCPRCSTDTLDEIKTRFETTELTQGALSIGSYGCSLIVHLVVTGPPRGEIWVDDFGSDNGMWPDGECCPCFFECQEQFEEARGDQRRFLFYEWYEHWLDGAFREYHERHAKT